MTVRHPNAAHFSSGQALAELIVACAVLAITLFGIVTTINFSVNSVAVSSNKTRANYYAQEGLEQARAARNADWTTFANGSYLGGAEGDAVRIAGTIFTRTISVDVDNSIPGNNDRRVTSAVTWFDGGTAFETEFVAILTNH